VHEQWHGKAPSLQSMCKRGDAVFFLLRTGLGFFYSDAEAMRGRHDMPAGRTETLLTPDWLFSLETQAELISSLDVHRNTRAYFLEASRPTSVNCGLIRLPRHACGYAFQLLSPGPIPAPPRAPKTAAVAPILRPAYWTPHSAATPISWRAFRGGFRLCAAALAAASAACPAADRHTLEAAARHPTRLAHIQRTPHRLRSPHRAKTSRSLHKLHSRRNLHTRRSL
jgi:hypothetical protein